MGVHTLPDLLVPLVRLEWLVSVDWTEFSASLPAASCKLSALYSKRTR